MRHVIPRFPQRLALRCAALLGALLLVGSLGVSGATAASPSPTDDASTPQPPRETRAAVPGPSVTGGATEAPSTDATSPTDSSSPSIGPTDPSPSGDPEPTPTPDPSDPSTPSTDPTPSPTESSQTPAPSTSTEPTHEPTRLSTPPKPSRHEPIPTRPSSGGPPSGSGVERSQGWSSAAGGRQYSNNGPRAVEQGGKRDARTGFRVDSATGFPIHPQTGLLIDPSNGRMLSRGSLEPTDFAYDFATGQIRLVTADQDDGGSVAEPTASSTAAGATEQDGTTAPAGYTGDGPQAHRADSSPTASIGMSPSTMTVVLGALVVVGGLWYFFVFVRTPRPRPQHRD